MVEDTVRQSASGPLPDADIVSAWKQDFEQQKAISEFGTVITLTLPSGKQVKAMRLPLLLIMQAKSIPDKLSQIVTEFIEAVDQAEGDPQKMDAKLQASLAADPLEGAKRWIDMINFVFSTCVVTPTFVDTIEEQDPDKGVFWVAAVNFYDKLWLFQWAQGVDQSVQEFLRQQIETLGASSDGEGLRLSPEQLLLQGEHRNVMASLASEPSRLDVGPVHPRKNRRNASSSRQKVKQQLADRPEVQPGSDHEDADRPVTETNAIAVT